MENIIGLGWWRCSNMKHLYYTPPAETSAQGAEEEIISGGLHHIITTQGTSPLTEEQPPVILPSIIHSASQGEAISTNIPPAVAYNSPGHVNVTIAPTSGTPTQVWNGEGGALLGNPLGIFSGDRSKAQKLLDTINIWRVVNYKKEIMRDPFTHIALVLTYIKGENVDNWAKHQLIKLLNKERRSLGGLPSEEWWEDFIQDFRDRFTFTASKETALMQLEKLTMGKDGIDTYIATFNWLLDEADFSWRDKGAIEMFKRGLNLSLRINCIKRKPRPVTMCYVYRLCLPLRTYLLADKWLIV